MEGTLAGAVDDSSPIYVQLGGSLYEACPVGSGECPFTLYVPEAFLAEAAQVLYLSNGTLYLAAVS